MKSKLGEEVKRRGTLSSWATVITGALGGVVANEERLATTSNSS
jgi:hypothetical protein